jgi:selenocysteine lyase/cysteine desulfurase
MAPFSDEELKEFRYLFPVTKKFIYFNHAAVAPISLRVVDAISQFNHEALHEGYTAGPRWVKHIEKTRTQCAQLIGAAPEEIAFVKNTSHGLSLVARGLHFKGGDEIIFSDQEFPANVYPWMALEKIGVHLKKIPSQNGNLDLTTLPDLITPRTRLVALSSVQYGTGFRLPVSEIGELCRDRGVLFCVDAIQSLGAFPIHVESDQVDFLSSDAHKWILGQEGIGIFYCRKDLLERLEPTLLGWNSVQRAHDFDHIDFKLRTTAAQFEEGSHNVMSIYGLGAAVDLLLEIGVDHIAERILHLTDILVAGLQKMELPLVSPLEKKFRSGIVTFRLSPEKSTPAIAELQDHLFAKGIYTSIRHGGLRLSPHFYNTEEEVETTLKEIKEFLHLL